MYTVVQKIRAGQIIRFVTFLKSNLWMDCIKRKLTDEKLNLLKYIEPSSAGIFSVIEKQRVLL